MKKKSASINKCFYLYRFSLCFCFFMSKRAISVRYDVKCYENSGYILNIFTRFSGFPLLTLSRSTMPAGKTFKIGGRWNVNATLNNAISLKIFETRLFSKCGSSEIIWRCKGLLFVPFPHYFIIHKNKYFRGFIVKEAVVQRCSVKKVFLEISQNSQENTCARVSFLINL